MSLRPGVDPAFVCLTEESPANTVVRWNTPGLRGAGASEVVIPTLPQASGLAAAATDGCRWTARCQQRAVNDTAFVTRLVVARGAGPWHELPARTSAAFSCAIAALDDTSCLLVEAGRGGLRWAVATPAGWSRDGVLDATPNRFLHLRLDGREDGRVDLYASTRDGIRRLRYSGGVWRPAGEARCKHAGDGAYWSSWLDVAAGPNDGPRLVVWGDRGHDANRRDVLCAAWFADSPAEITAVEVPGSEGAIEACTRLDRDGSAWIAWRPLRGGPLRVLGIRAPTPAPE